MRDVQRGNPIAAQSFVAINADTSLQLNRTPRGEWIGFDAEVRYGPEGAGLGRAALSDVDGPVGYAQQSLLLRDKGDEPPAWESQLTGEAEEAG